jgi:hypothetical protein
MILISSKSIKIIRLELCKPICKQPRLVTTIIKLSPSLTYIRTLLTSCKNRFTNNKPKIIIISNFMIKTLAITKRCFILLRVLTRLALFHFQISSQIIGDLNSSNLCRVKLKKLMQLKMMPTHISAPISTMKINSQRLSLRKKFL